MVQKLDPLKKAFLLPCKENYRRRYEEKRYWATWPPEIATSNDNIVNANGNPDLIQIQRHPTQSSLLEVSKARQHHQHQVRCQEAISQALAAHGSPRSLSVFGNARTPRSTTRALTGAQPRSSRVFDDEVYVSEIFEGFNNECAAKIIEKDLWGQQCSPTTIFYYNKPSCSTLGEFSYFLYVSVGKPWVEVETWKVLYLRGFYSNKCFFYTH